MLKTKTLDELISVYYDNEMSLSQLMNFEARIAVSKSIRNHTNETSFEYFKISSSIKQVKKRCDKKAQEITKNFKIPKKRNLIYVYAIFLQSIYKGLRSLLLDCLRNNSK